MQTTELMKLSDLADTLGYSERHIYRLCDSGRIPYFRSPWKNAAYMFDLNAVKEALRKKKNG